MTEKLSQTSIIVCSQYVQLNKHALTNKALYGGQAFAIAGPVVCE